MFTEFQIERFQGNAPEIAVKGGGQSIGVESVAIQ